MSGSNFELGGVPIIVPYIMPMRLMGDIRDAPEVLAEAGDVLGTLADAGSPRISGTSCSLLSIVIYEVEVKHINVRNHGTTNRFILYLYLDQRMGWDASF